MRGIKILFTALMFAGSFFVQAKEEKWLSEFTYEQRGREQIALGKVLVQQQLKSITLKELIQRVPPTKPVNRVYITLHDKNGKIKGSWTFLMKRMEDGTWRILPPKQAEFKLTTRHSIGYKS